MATAAGKSRRASSDRSPAPGLNPVDFQLIFDVVDSLQPTKGFLRHLLLIVGADRPAQNDASLLRFKTKIASLQVWAPLDGRGNQRIERALGIRHGICTRGGMILGLERYGRSAGLDRACKYLSATWGGVVRKSGRAIWVCSTCRPFIPVVGALFDG